MLASIAAASEIEGVRELIHQGMLARAQARLTAIQESVSGFQELKQLEDALEERRKRARDAAENAKSALEKQDLRGAADAIDQALTFEADNSEHYDLIDNALQAMRKQFQDCDGRVKTMREQGRPRWNWEYLAQELGNKDYVYFCAHILKKTLAGLREKPLQAVLYQRINDRLKDLKRVHNIAVFATKLRQRIKHFFRQHRRVYARRSEAQASCQPFISCSPRPGYRLILPLRSLVHRCSASIAVDLFEHRCDIRLQGSNR